jgi:pectate lyase
MAHFVEGHWKGELKVVRNPMPKVRSGVVDMYGNYFEKGYLYP